MSGKAYEADFVSETYSKTLVEASYDLQADATYVKLVKNIVPGAAIRQAEVNIPGIQGTFIFDIAGDNTVLGIEILNVSETVPSLVSSLNDDQKASRNNDAKSAIESRFKKFEALEPWALEDGWKTPSEASVSVARALAYAVVDAGLQRPGVFPLESGGIQLEWANPIRVVNVEIYNTGMAMSLMSVTVTTQNAEELDTTNVAEALDFLKRTI